MVRVYIGLTYDATAPTFRYCTEDNERKFFMSIDNLLAGLRGLQESSPEPLDLIMDRTTLIQPNDLEYLKDGLAKYVRGKIRRVK